MSLNHVKEYNREIRRWLEKVFLVAASIPKECLVYRVCPVCESASSTFFANNDNLDYVQCDECSLIYMNPAPTSEAVDKGFQGEDALLMEYFNIIRKYKTGIPERQDPLSDNKLKDIYRLKQNGRLLDIGCSVGDFLHKARHFYDVEGLEINPLTSRIAEKDFVVHKKYLHELDLGKRYDVVTLNQILYGIPDPASLLKDIGKILKDDGVLYINTPNSDSYAMELFRGKSNHLFGYTTLNVFNKHSLEECARKAGFYLASFRTEWLDIYTPDLMLFLDGSKDFIHKRNCQVPGYEGILASEDDLQQRTSMNLGNRGNYLVAILKKTT